MYDYDRTAASRPRTYAEAVEHAVKMYGVKRGAERKLVEAKRIARELDGELKGRKGLNPDDEWAHDPSKAERLWRELQKPFSYCFGYDPPKLGTL